MKKILKWTGLILLIVLVGLVITVMSRQHLKYDAPYPAITASKDSAMIARGRHLVLGPAHCVDCHSPVKNVDSMLSLGQDPPLSGGLKFDLPFGNFFVRNITPDAETGIGNMSDGEFARLLRYGVKKNGEAALPFMPFQNMTDEDLTAIISYLRSTKPVKNPVPDHDYNLMGRVIKAFLIKPEGPTETIHSAVWRDTTADYGRHLAMVVANCNECHTKRDGIGNFIGKTLAGGTKFEEEGQETLITPNLTPHPSGRIYTWSQETFIKRFRMGKLIKHSHMPWASYGRMTDDELKAIYHFLQTLEPVETEKN